MAKLELFAEIMTIPNWLCVYREIQEVEASRPLVSFRNRRWLQLLSRGGEGIQCGLVICVCILTRKQTLHLVYSSSSWHYLLLPSMPRKLYLCPFYKNDDIYHTKSEEAPAVQVLLDGAPSAWQPSQVI